MFLVAAVALALDLCLGDPPNRWHPVAWFGKLTAAVFDRAPTGRGPELAFGVAVALGAPLAVWLGASRVLDAAHGVAAPLGVLAAAALFKVSFAYRGLRDATRAVADALEGDAVETARARLGALVSRDTAVLSAPLAASAAIESLAENLNDSVVAPFFYFVLFGVPGAVAYRAVNTLDAMVGYHGRYEYLGKAAARLDDTLGWIPARLTALLLVGGALLAGAHAADAIRLGWRQHGRTDSPNAGWPMATMAGALGTVLEKTHHYRLGDDPHAQRFSTVDAASVISPTPRSIHKALRIADCTVGLAALLLLAISLR